MGKTLWPVYEFRPTPEYMGGTVLRYANGKWIKDDGKWDVAFVCYGACAPFALYVNLPYRENILWSGLTTHWSEKQKSHPNENAWHYALREGKTDCGGWWGRYRHKNTIVGDLAMSKCCSINSCANGRGPNFEIGDKFIAAGLVREKKTKRVVEFPKTLSCMYCGDGWEKQHRKVFP